jgi:hypothetical protein
MSCFSTRSYHLQVHGKKLLTMQNTNLVQNRTGNVTQHLGEFVQPLLQWKSNNYYII